MVLCGELGTGTEPVRDSGPGVLRLSLSPVLEDHVPPPGASHAFGLLHCFLAPKACLVQSTLKGNQWDHRYVCAESPCVRATTPCYLLSLSAQGCSFCPEPLKGIAVLLTLPLERVAEW